ncbi:LCP family protein [Tessaracoccus sp. MC1627]|nr:LCP family protein [Tessaracoccus sp. MC1627]MBB1514226.1 LCP family protein [Tessaracoccus sp. MC1627]
MDWLYRQESPDEPEPTAVMPAYPPPTRPAAPAPSVAAPPPPPKAPRRRTRRRRRPLRRFVGTMLVLWLLFLLVTPLYAWVISTRVDATPAGDRPADQPGTTVLLVGSDARAGVAGARTDTMMLMHRPAVGDPVLLSMPRDSLVSIPGRSDNRLNAAFAFGGAPLLVETVEANTGIRIDGYLEVGFDGVVDVVDALGGIEVCPTFDIDDRDSHLTMSAGCQRVDGTTALGYVRMRKGDPRGDLGRVDRQREVMGAMAREVIHPMTVLNPVRYWQLNMAAAQSLGRGEDTGLLDMAAVAAGFFAATTGSGISMTVPVAGTGNVSGVGSVVRWDDAAAAEVFSALAAGDTTGLSS